MEAALKKVQITSGVITGGLSLMLYTSLVNKVLFKGFNYCSTSSLEYALFGLSLFSSALIAGFISSLVVIRRSMIPHVALSLFVLAYFSTTVVCTQHLWYEIITTFLLLSGIWLGRFSAMKFPLAPM